MKQEKKKIILEKKDYDFIDNFCKEYSVVEGKGYDRLFEVFLNEYKLTIRSKR